MAELNDNQLKMIMHLANGKTIEEIAADMNFSPSNVGKVLRTARTKMGARNLPHLVSIVIAQGWLYYSPDDNKRSVVEGQATST